MSGCDHHLPVVRRLVLATDVAWPVKMIGNGLQASYSEYDVILIADVPNTESMAAIAVAIAAGGAIKSSHTTALLTGAELVAALKKSESVVKGYKPAR